MSESTSSNEGKVHLGTEIEVKRDTLITFETGKYLQQVVALKPADGGMNIAIFDAVELFMTEDRWVERKRIWESGKAKAFAEKFVATFNAGAAIA